MNQSNGNNTYGMTVRFANSPWQSQIKIEAYSPQEAMRIAESMYQGIRILNPPYLVEG